MELLTAVNTVYKHSLQQLAVSTGPLQALLIPPTLIIEAGYSETWLHFYPTTRSHILEGSLYLK